MFTRYGRNIGFTLIEMMIAMVILASAFIPIMGVMGVSAKATDKDNRTIKAMQLCAKKLNAALQIPFNGPLKPPAKGSTTWGELANDSVTSGNITLDFGHIPVDGIPFRFVLKTEDVPVTFHVPIYDPFVKGQNPTNPALWWPSKKDKLVKYSGVYTKYTLTVYWSDQGKSTPTKHYTLVSFKAKEAI